MVTNVYSQYFQANATFSGVERRGALVLLISDSEAGMISYKVAVSFFPHKDPEDFAVSYDAYFENPCATRSTQFPSSTMRRSTGIIL